MLERQRMRLVVTALTLVASGCYATLPPQLAEGTEVLRSGGVKLAVSGGAATFQARDRTGAWNGLTAGGFEARLRTGIGDRQELGASLFGGAGTSVGGDAPLVVGGKLAYKIAPTPWLAIVAGGGVMDWASSSTLVFSGDLALVAAAYTSAHGTQVYVGGKAAFALPVLNGSIAVNESLVAPIGVATPAGERATFYVEGGPIFGFAEQFESGTSSATWGVGPYAAMAFSFQFR